MTDRRGRGIVGEMRVTPLRWLLPALVAVGSVSCDGGTETGNPSFEAKLSYAAFSSTPQAIAVRDPGTVATVDAAWLVLGEVGFVLEGTCDAPAAEQRAAPAIGIGDHATGHPVTTPFQATAGGYCRVELPLAVAPDGPLLGGAPDALRGRSIVLEGSLANGTPFEIASRSTSAFVLAADGGSFALDPEHPGAILTFDVASWLADVDWANATLSNGRIAISETENPALLAEFEAALDSGVALYRDRESDGLLDASPERLAH